MSTDVVYLQSRHLPNMLTELDVSIHVGMHSPDAHMLLSRTHSKQAQMRVDGCFHTSGYVT